MPPVNQPPLLALPPPGATLPQEILGRIFEEATWPSSLLYPQSLSDPLHLAHVAKGISHPEVDYRTIWSLMRICRTWRYAVARAFFTSIYVPYSESDDYKFVGLIAAFLHSWGPGHSEGWIKRLNIPYKLLGRGNVRYLNAILKLSNNIRTFIVRPLAYEQINFFSPEAFARVLTLAEPGSKKGRIFDTFAPETMVLPLCGPSSLDFSPTIFTTVVSLTLLVSTAQGVMPDHWVFPKLEYLSIRYIEEWLYPSDADGCLPFLSRHAGQIKSLHLTNIPNLGRFIRFIKEHGFPLVASLIITPAELRDLNTLDGSRDRFSAIGSLTVADTVNGRTTATRGRALRAVNRFINKIDSLFPEVRTVRIADLDLELFVTGDEMDEKWKKLWSWWKQTAEQARLRGVLLVDATGLQVPTSPANNRKISIKSSVDESAPALEDAWWTSFAGSEASTPSLNLLVSSHPDQFLVHQIIFTSNSYSGTPVCRRTTVDILEQTRHKPSYTTESPERRVLYSDPAPGASRSQKTYTCIRDDSVAARVWPQLAGGH